MLTVGEIFRKARSQKNLTFKDVEKATKIRERYLQGIENNDWTTFSSRVYIAGVIRRYADFLDLDPDRVLAYFRRDYERTEEVKFKKTVPSLQLLPETKKVIIGVAIFLFVIFGGFIAVQFQAFLAPPNVEIIAPEETVFRNTPRVTVIGKTQPEAAIVIFGENIYPDENGVFRYEFPLQKGRNRLTIEVTGANGKTAEVTKDYLLE
ncbi:MAG: helix-turn-helix domain-containing protein [Weeksellaceae bacterium]